MMTVYLTHPEGTRTELPPCSPDWQPSAFWVVSCIHDPVGPLCRRHQSYFKIKRKANQ